MHVEANVYFMHNYTGLIFHWTFTVVKDSSVSLFNDKLFIGYFWLLTWFQLFKTVFLSQHKSVKKSRVLLQGPAEACDKTAITLKSFPRPECRPSWVQTQHTDILASFHILGSCGHSLFPPRTFVFKTQAFPWARYGTVIGYHKSLQQVCEENVVINSGTNKGSGLFSVIFICSRPVRPCIVPGKVRVRSVIWLRTSVFSPPSSYIWNSSPFLSQAVPQITAFTVMEFWQETSPIGTPTAYELTLVPSVLTTYRNVWATRLWVGHKNPLVHCVLEPPQCLWNIPASILLSIFHGRCLGAFFRTGSNFTPPFVSCNWPSLRTWHLLSQSSNTVSTSTATSDVQENITWPGVGQGKYELFQTCNLPDYPVYPKSKQ